MGMRYRRSNRANHGGYSPRVQITAILLGPWSWFLVLLAAAVSGWPAALFAYGLLIVSVWVPWDRIGPHL